MTGKILDNKYKILKELGEGGFERVYLADDELAKRKVAIKILLEISTLKDSDLIREIEFLASLEHANIVRFYHHFYFEDKLCLVMEHCKKGSLSNKIYKEGKINTDAALEYTTQICDALSFVHSQDIIHHDIKPNNLLLSEEQIIKIADFGIANTNGGTILYLAPEVYTSDYNTSTDPKIDIYSLGITTLEMIMGSNPFDDCENRSEILSRKLNHNFIPTNLPQWLQEILLKATNPIPELRFNTTKEFSESISRKSTPYNINKDVIKSELLFVIANKSLKNKNWSKAINYIEHGAKKNKNSAFGCMTAGKYYLKTHNLNKAKKYLERALKLNPGVDVKKELAEIQIQNGNYSQAISLLNNHIQLNSSDWEAYNLLIECFYRISRFETANEILETVIPESKLKCFFNNKFINELAYSLSKTETEKDQYTESEDPFSIFNRSILNDNILSWDNLKTLKNKLLYQDFRFNVYKKSNKILLNSKNRRNKKFEKPIITIGRNDENDFVVSDNSVSRRHCVVINYENDVWIYDLGSTLGTFVDGKEVKHKFFLLGKHQIRIGNYEFELFTDENMIL